MDLNALDRERYPIEGTLQVPPDSDILFMFPGPDTPPPTGKELRNWHLDLNAMAPDLFPIDEVFLNDMVGGYQ